MTSKQKNKYLYRFINEKFKHVYADDTSNIKLNFVDFWKVFLQKTFLE